MPIRSPRRAVREGVRTAAHRDSRLRELNGRLNRAFADLHHHIGRAVDDRLLQAGVGTSTLDLSRAQVKPGHKGAAYVFVAGPIADGTDVAPPWDAADSGSIARIVARGKVGPVGGPLTLTVRSLLRGTIGQITVGAGATQGAVDRTSLALDTLTEGESLHLDALNDPAVTTRGENFKVTVHMALESSLTGVVAT